MTIELERRAFVQAGVALAAGAAVVGAVAPAMAQTAGPAPAGPKPMTFDVKPMPFDPTKIKGLSEKILTSHYVNNYTGAVKRLNQITEQLAGLDYAKAPGYLINGLKREELIATNSMILHEVYFGGLGPEESRPGPALAEALARAERPAGAGKDRDFKLVVAAELRPGLGEPRAHFMAERIEALGPVHPHDEDLPVTLGFDDCHFRLSWML